MNKWFLTALLICLSTAACQSDKTTGPVSALPGPYTGRGVHHTGAVLRVPSSSGSFGDPGPPLRDTDIQLIRSRWDVTIGPFLRDDIALLGSYGGLRLHYSWVNSVNGPGLLYPPGDQASGWEEVNRNEEASFTRPTLPVQWQSPSQGVSS